MLDASHKPKLDELLYAWYHHLGLSNKGIATLLGKDEAAVSKGLKYAKKQGWVRIELNIPPEYEDVMLTHVKEKEHEREAERRFKSLHKCTVAPSIDLPDPLAQRKGEDDLDLLSTIAARRFADIVASPKRPHSDHVIGVSWGYTINQAIERMDRFLTSGSKHWLNIAPIIGNFSVSREPTAGRDKFPEEELDRAYEHSVKYSANSNSRLLSAKCYQDIPPRPLLLVAILNASDEEFANCAPMFRSDRTLIDLYGEFWDEKKEKKHPGKIWQMDTILTGIGTGSLPENWSYKILGYGMRKAKKSFVGDISGLLFDRRGKTADIDPKRKIIGPRLEHIHSLADRHRTLKARKEGPLGAGVVVVASGEEKADAIRILLENGYINELITDRLTIEEVFRLQDKSA